VGFVVKPTGPPGVCALRAGCVGCLCRRLSSGKPSLFPVLSRQLQQPIRQPGGTVTKPASRTKSFPGFVSPTAPLRPSDRHNRQGEGNRSPAKNLMLVWLSALSVRSAGLREGNKSFPGFVSPTACASAFFFGPGCAVLSVCGLALRLALPQATGSPIGKVNCFGKTALSVPVTALDHGHSGGSLCSMGGRAGV